MRLRGELGLELGRGRRACLPRRRRCRRCRRLRRRRSSCRSARLLASAALTTMARLPAPAGAHQRAGRDEVGEVERGDRCAPWRAARQASCRWRDRGRARRPRRCPARGWRDTGPRRRALRAIRGRARTRWCAGRRCRHRARRRRSRSAGGRRAVRSLRSRETVMRPLIGLAASAPRIAGMRRFLAASTLSCGDAAGLRRSRRATPPCHRGRPAQSRRPNARPPSNSRTLRGVEGMDRRDRRAIERW